MSYRRLRVHLWCHYGQHLEWWCGSVSNWLGKLFLCNAKVAYMLMRVSCRVASHYYAVSIAIDEGIIAKVDAILEAERAA